MTQGVDASSQAASCQAAPSKAPASRPARPEPDGAAPAREALPVPPAAPAGSPSPLDGPQPRTLAALAARLLAEAEAGGALIHVAASEARAEALGRILRALAPERAVLVLPPWDCLPYDRAAPSRAVLGQRVAALAGLLEAEAWILLATPDALLQRVPNRRLWHGPGLRLDRGGRLPPDFEAACARLGYETDDRVDEPGEMAPRGQVIDLFPGGAEAPVRIEHDGDAILALRRFDAASQRSTDEIETVRIGPVVEQVRVSEEGPGEPAPPLETVFDLAPGAGVVIEAGAERRLRTFLDQVADAHGSRLRLGAGGEGSAAPPDRLYLDEAGWEAALRGRRVSRLGEPEGEDAALAFATRSRPAQALAARLRQALEAGQTIVLAGLGPDRERLVRAARRGLGRGPEPAASWREVLAAPPGSVLALDAPFDGGFADERAGLLALAPADLLGSRARVETGEAAPAALPFADLDLRLGDAVIHIEHGLARLAALETLDEGEAAEGAAEIVRLEYADGATLMVPVDQIGQVWRYGAEAEAVTLDRLDGATWPRRRAAVEAAIAEAAGRFVAAARHREGLSAPALVPPERDYQRFVARFPYPETGDQARAVADVLADLASGKPMNRLVCGDVGFGKTEVALRAAAAAALAGKQVAVVAPTTVLVRQHAATFARRFAGFGLEVGQLSRLVGPAEARAVKAGLADGRIRVVIGTHALAAKGVRFHDLGLVVVDEEQRFGAAHKERLRALGETAHLLTLTATPIPRTLQSALVGLQSLSLLATPPAARRPVRTFLTPFDPVTVREALKRERRRGGQSFVVCPRVEDIEPMARRLTELVPELGVAVAHGGLPPAEIDRVMVAFAEGEGDVLLATNIIESGLDVPRANTMLVWRADRFGLAQLHQLRGRVGRGRARGVAYLLTEPGAEIPAATRKRLGTLVALDQVGAGFAVSARDLDQRGAGDLFGEAQAGHVKLVGAGLYQHLLRRAVRVAAGETVPEDWSPAIRIGLHGRIPEAYVPEPEVRLNLYARLARLNSSARIAAFADEVEDRFGPLPAGLRRLVALARLRLACRRRGIAALDIGPRAAALTPRPGLEEAAARAASELGGGGLLAWREGRLVHARETASLTERYQAGMKLLGLLTPFLAGPAAALEGEGVAPDQDGPDEDDPDPIEAEEQG